MACGSCGIGIGFTSLGFVGCGGRVLLGMCVVCPEQCLGHMCLSPGLATSLPGPRPSPPTILPADIRLGEMPRKGFEKSQPDVKGGRPSERAKVTFHLQYSHLHVGLVSQRGKGAGAPGRRQTLALEAPGIWGWLHGPQEAQQGVGRD